MFRNHASCYQALVNAMGFRLCTYIWEAESKVHDTHWIIPIAFGGQYSKCCVLTLVLGDIDWIHINGKSLVVPNV